MFYDALLMAAALYAAAIPAVWVHGGAVPPDEPWFQAWLALVAWFYLALSWTRGGQTLGMRAWRCRLVTADGGPVGWGRTVARFAAALVSWARARPRLLVGPRRPRPALLARPLVRHPDRPRPKIIRAFARRECLFRHDRWSGTRVIVIPR